MPDGLDDPPANAADALRSLERALAVAERRRRLRRGLAVLAAALIVALVVLVAILLIGDLQRWTPPPGDVALQHP